ncbi:DUF4040 domain-containing protein [Iningainema tapete]|uniref:DUF4040 domain-containing protein n=1 Tax=Iningainema tapete BLCC-T55 TaxID=2748662 RepID=A0A8J6XJQ6_9CYAN|nr:DUF4040 domain-containing protein [Iningainema tapete]MBD2773786.1 DUF4040 domain-containing protein [Iningainema tapete BLCC-T55]
MNDSYVSFIIALLPLAACMVVFEVNPYNALVIRGILGALAAMTYAILGAADVALTEALVGTMLAITLYTVAVRSSLVLRLGLLKDESVQKDSDRHFNLLIEDLRTIFRKRHMRLELVTYEDNHALHQALMDKEVHATCSRLSHSEDQDEKLPYQTAIRVRRVYDIIQGELSSTVTNLTYVNTPNSKEGQT